MKPLDDGPAPSPGPGATRTNLDAVRRLAKGSVLAGRYVIDRMLGIGGMGMVYLARDEQLDIDVAIKTLRPDLAGQAGLLERFRRELILARQVSHRNVVRIHDVGMDGDIHFITMDYVAGESLREVLRREGALGPERAADIGRQLAEALAAAHREDVVHRDLKPSNVMLDESGRAYITDFGVARSLTAVGLTETGAMVGTPDYLSPEQAGGEEVDGRSDIYALGILLFEMITGELPFSSESLTETVAQRIAGKPQRLGRLDEGVPPGLRSIVKRCLEPSPRRRYATAGDLAAELADYSRVRPSFDPRRAWVVAGSILVLVALLGASWLYVTLRSDPAATAVPTVAQISLGDPAIALLPLSDESGSPRLAWLAQGLPELLAEVLSESSSLRVADSRRVAQAVEDLKLDPGAWSDSELRQVAELFDVDRMFYAAVRSVGDQVWIDGRLVGREDSGELSLRSVEAKSAEAEVAGGLVAELAAALRRELELVEPGVNPLRSSSPEAIRLLGEGMRLSVAADPVAAERELEAAVAADPELGAAWYRLSDVYAALGKWTQAENAAQRAVATLEDEAGRLMGLARSRLALLENEPQKASEILERVSASYPNDIDTLLALAEAQEQMGALGEAIGTLERITALTPNHPRAWFLMGKNSILSGDSRAAVDEYLVRAMVIQNGLRSDRGRADVLNAFGVAYRELGELDRAEEYYLQAAELRRDIEDRRGYAISLRNLAQVRLYRGDYDAAEESLSEARAILVELEDEAGIADLYNEWGVLEEERGRYEAALEQYRRALKLRRDLGDQRAQAESLNNVGYAYFLLGEYDNASVYWRQALDLFRDAGNLDGEVLVTQSLGQLELAQGRWNRAVDSYLAALEIAREIEFLPAIAVSLGHLGRLAQYQGRFAAALESFDEALTAIEKLEDPRGLAEFTLAKAETLLEIGQGEEAREELDQVSALLAGSGNHEQLARLELLFFELGGERQRLENARAEAEASGSAAATLEVALAAERDAPAARQRDLLERAEELGNARLRLIALESLALARRREADLQGAARALEEALELTAQAGSYSGGHRLYHLQAKVRAAAGGHEDAEADRERSRQEFERIATGLSASQRQSLEQRATEQW